MARVSGQCSGGKEKIMVERRRKETIFMRDSFRNATPPAAEAGGCVGSLNYIMRGSGEWLVGGRRSG
jgi:hypothetical protein